MDWQTFLQNVIVTITASIPIDVVVAYVLVAIKNSSMNGYKLVGEKIGASKEKTLIQEFKENVNQTKEHLEDVVDNVKALCDDTIEKVSENVCDTLDSMENKLKLFSEKVEALEKQNEELNANYNVMTEIMMSLICKDSSLVRDGVAQRVQNVLLSNNIKSSPIDSENTKKVLSEIVKNVGLDKFKEIVEELNDEIQQ